MSMSNNPEIEDVQHALAKSMHRHWRLSLLEGIVLVILGVAAIAMPRTVTVELLFGGLFLISGVMGLITVFVIRPAPGFWWSLLSAILGIWAGLVMLISPVHGVLSLTLILIVFFVIEGVASIMYALDHKRAQSGRWDWVLMAGIVDLIVAALILFGLPGSAAWALGLLVGLDLIFGGAALAAMALHARR